MSDIKGIKKFLWMRGPKRLWVRSHDWKYDEEGRPYNADLTRLASWVLR